MKKRLSIFLKEAMHNTITVRGIDNIPRINRVEFNDYTPNTDAQNDVIFSGKQQNSFADIMGSIISPEEEEKLRIAYGPNWIDLVKQKVAVLAKTQPNTQRYQNLDADAETLYNTARSGVDSLLDKGWGYS